MEQFQNNVPQRKIMKTLNIPSLTINDIKKINILRIWRHICAKGTWLKISIGYLFLFGPSSGKNWHDPVIENTALAQEHFQKSLSVNTVHHTFHTCSLKLFHAQKSCKDYTETTTSVRYFLQRPGLKSKHLKTATQEIAMAAKTSSRWLWLTKYRKWNPSAGEG